MYVKDINLFMRKKSKNVSKKWAYKRQLCLKCLVFFKNKESLKKHALSCTNPAGQMESYPKPGETIEFKNYNHKVC